MNIPFSPWRLCLFFLVLSLSASPLRAEEGLHALVFGNADYANNGGMSALPSAAADAQLFATLLSRSGFTMVKGEERDFTGAYLNLTRAQMLKKIERMQAAAETADTIILYFAGHGGQVGDDMYLLPTDAFVRKGHMDSDLSRHGLSLRSITADLKPKNGKGLIVVVDACRISESAPSSTYTNDKNVLTIFSTSAGEVAKSGSDGKPGPFTNALVQALARGKNMRDAMVDANEAAKKNQDQQANAFGDLIGPLAGTTIKYVRPQTAPSPSTSSSQSPASSSTGATGFRPVRLTSLAKESLTLRDTPAGNQIGNVLQNHSSDPIGECDPSRIVTQKGQLWIPVRCSGWVIQERISDHKSYLKLHDDRFTVERMPVNLRPRPSIGKGVLKVVDLDPGVSGTALGYTATDDGFDWRMIRISGWVLLENRTGQPYLKY